MKKLYWLNQDCTWIVNGGSLTCGSETQLGKHHRTLSTNANMNKLFLMNYKHARAQTEHEYNQINLWFQLLKVYPYMKVVGGYWFTSPLDLCNKCYIGQIHEILLRPISIVVQRESGYSDYSGYWWLNV